MLRLFRPNIVALVAVGLVCASSASAQSPIGAFPPGTFQNRAALDAPGGSSPTFTPGANVTRKNNGFAPGTITFTGLNGGTNYPSGALVLVGLFQDQSALTLTSPQIGGNAASIVSGSQDSSTKCTFYQATMPSSS